MEPIKQNLVADEDFKPRVMPGSDAAPPLAIGQWFWVSDTYCVDDDGDPVWHPSDKSEWKQVEHEWLGCVVDVGSNYATLEGQYHKTRIHLDEFEDRCRDEPNATAVLHGEIERCRGEIRHKMNEIRELTRRLGVTPREAIGHDTQVETSRELSVVSEAPDIAGYKRQLIVAKDTELPALFNEVKELSKEMADWMTAEMIPHKAESEIFKGATAMIEDRIFSVEVYAGLTESAIQVRKGEPAPIGTKLHIMQSRLYMDEESLLDYRHGGIDIRSIEEFDRWLSRPKNLHRLLPHDRTLVAIRVRRYDKKYKEDGTLSTAWINIQMKQDDKITFIYIRNGDQLWRIDTEVEFGGRLFPDHTDYDFTEPHWFRIERGEVGSVIPEREYEDLKARQIERQAKWQAWEDSHQHLEWINRNNPYGSSLGGFREQTWKDYEPLNSTSVWFDDATNSIDRELKSYNRISLLVQGLLDRSTVLHPHPPVKLWNPESFGAAVELVFDQDRTLHHGEKPDFDAYFKRLASTIDDGTFTIGQRDAWLDREREREQRRRDSDYRLSGHAANVGDWWTPRGNPGPGFIAEVQNWKPKSRKATFRWMRARQRERWNCDNGKLQDSITVAGDKLFNVSDYQPGDYLQFFQDPRTRREYFKWAHLLLSAEEYHAGNASPIKTGKYRNEKLGKTVQIFGHGGSSSYGGNISDVVIRKLERGKPPKGWVKIDDED